MGVKRKSYKQAKVLLSIMERWRERGELTSLERDIALSKLSSIYEAILENTNADSEEGEDSSLELDCEPDLEANLDSDSQHEPEVEVEVLLYNEDEGEVIESLTQDDKDEYSEQEIEVEVLFYEDEEPLKEAISEQIISHDEEMVVFDSTKSRSARRAAILSLYEEDESAKSEIQDETLPREADSQAETQAVVEECDASNFVVPEATSELMPEMEVEVDEPVIPQTKTESMQSEPQREVDIIAERLSSNIDRLCDKLMEAGEQSTLADRISTTGFAMNLNDKFEIARELFAGDVEALEQLLVALDGLVSFDECVIYISENYSFSSDSDAAKMLLSLLERKFA